MTTHSPPRVLSYGMDYQLVHKQEIAAALCCAIQVHFLGLNTYSRAETPSLSHD